MAKPIHQEVELPASPDEVYETFMDEAKHSALTHGKAQISREAGGLFAQHDGQITGRNLDLVPGQRIVQAWRFEQWEPGLFSIVRFELKPNGDGTTVVMDHSGVPDEFEEGVADGWNVRYWEPLKKGG